VRLARRQSGRCVEEHDGFAGELDAADQPVERIFECAGKAVGVLGRGDDDGVGVLDGGAKCGDGGWDVCAVWIEKWDVAERRKAFHTHVSAREEGSGLKQEQVGGASAETAGNREDAEGRAHS
jgi:hypothetical protein